MSVRKRPMSILHLVLAAALPLAIAPAILAGDALSFEEVTLYFELNHTDGDLGIHGLVDGDAWDLLEIESPDRRQNLKVSAKGSLRRQGMTEIFFESEEPTFDELSPEAFFRRFDAGKWRITGRTLDGEELKNKVTLSHVMPAPPSGAEINGEPAAENCDATPLPSVSTPVTISWDPVTGSHPDVGADGPVVVARYDLVVEREEPSLLIFSVQLPPDVTSFEVPEDFTNLGGAFKFEILVRSVAGNQTVIESCFELD